MISIEDRFRDGLQTLAAGAPDGVAVGSVDASMRQHQRHRTTRLAIVAACAVSVTGLLSWFAATPRPVTVVPAPMATPGATSATVQFFGYRAGDPLVYHLVSVALERVDQQWVIQVTDQPQTLNAETITRTYRNPVGEYFTALIREGVALAVWPGPAKAVQPVGREWGITQRREVREAGVTLAVVSAEGLRAMPPLAWLDPNDEVRQAGSGVVTSARLVLDDRRIVVYRAGDERAWGAFGDEYGLPTFMRDPRQAEVRIMGPAGRLESIGMLPRGATRVTITPREPATWSVGEASDGSVWYYLRAVRRSTSDSSTDRYVKSISYTDANGKRVTYRPELRN